MKASQDVLSAVTVLFIVGMIWLRTRTQYATRSRGVLQLQPVGRIYFMAAIAALVLGWLLALPIGRFFWSGASASPGSIRVIWFLGTYYVFILVHRILKLKGLAVYKAIDHERV